MRQNVRRRRKGERSEPPQRMILTGAKNGMEKIEVLTISLRILYLLRSNHLLHRYPDCAEIAQGAQTMDRSYDLAAALKTLIYSLETNDAHSIAPYCNEETEMLRELFRAIPNPHRTVDEQAFLDSLNSFYHAYSVVLEKSCLDPEDSDTIQSFMDKLAQKIEGLRHFPRCNAPVA